MKRRYSWTGDVTRVKDRRPGRLNLEVEGSELCELLSDLQNDLHFSGHARGDHPESAYGKN